MTRDLDTLTVNTIRTLAIDAIQEANSGHPGLPLGAAPMAYVLWQRYLRHDPADPAWPNRDRFVLSAGHGSMLQYALLHLTGYDLPLEELRRFRQWESLTPGHPEYRHTPGVEATTGPLGQGTANAVGMALAERRLAAQYNRPGHEIVDHRTWAIVSDGDLMEGLSAEAASLAGLWKLGKLTYLYDANDVCLDGPTSACFTEDVPARYRAAGWHVVVVEDGDTDLAAIDAALAEAVAEAERPSLIVVHTTIGYGSPNKAGSSAAHGAPLGEEEVAATKAALGWTEPEPFTVPDAVRAHADATERGTRARTEWLERFEAWRAAHPDLAADWDRAHAETPPPVAGLPTWEAGEKVATRAAGGKALNALAAALPELVGGDADLSCSTKTALANESSFLEDRGRNVQFGVREHAMGAIANGMAYHGGLLPYTATFFVFSDYMRPAMRLAAMNGLGVVFVFTHDSLGVGEDGPTHQPVEQLASLRAMPGLHVVRPADANETSRAWELAVRRRSGPTALVLSRQGLPVSTPADAPVERGAYVVAGAEGEPDAILIATGSELWVALAARETLRAEGIDARVVSMPCWEAFAEQDARYRDEVLPPSVVARVAVEAGTTFGWERWVGTAGRTVGVDRFGASAPGDEVLAKLGITPEAAAAAVRSLVGKPVGSAT